MAASAKEGGPAGNAAETAPAEEAPSANTEEEEASARAEFHEVGGAVGYHGLHVLSPAHRGGELFYKVSLDFLGVGMGFAVYVLIDGADGHRCRVYDCEYRRNVLYLGLGRLQFLRCLVEEVEGQLHIVFEAYV